jgi:NAD(P)-dependent dehydrogenase (short-subunit alcohol dehydrogenase family)
MSALPSSSGVAVITGAASGIGAGLAKFAANRGMAVVLADWDAEGLEKVAGGIEGQCATLKVDVREEADLVALANLAFDRFGQVDLLFNNAGVLSAGLSWELTSEVWKRNIDVNIIGVVNGIRAFVPRLLAADRPARIINTASVGGFFVNGLMGPYFASKAAVVAITESLAHDLASVGGKVTTSVLAPGPVNTGILREEGGAGAERMMDRMRELTQQHSADPDAYAALIFGAIDRGEFWIVPQPESLDDRLKARTEMILERRSPIAPK